MPERYTHNDKWSRRAAEEGYRARSVYKLKELDSRFKLLKKGMTVLDLGAAPGSWMQYECEKVGEKGLVIGMDLQTIEPIEDNVHTYVQDINDLDAIEGIMEKEGVQKVDLVVSDLAPATTGIKDVDQWQSILLSQSVIRAAEQFLKDKGVCVIKVFQGSDFDEFLRNVKKNWPKTRIAHVRASRDRSKEVYIIVKK